MAPGSVVSMALDDSVVSMALDDSVVSMALGPVVSKALGSVVSMALGSVVSMAPASLICVVSHPFNTRVSRTGTAQATAVAKPRRIMALLP